MLQELVIVGIKKQYSIDADMLLTMNIKLHPFVKKKVTFK